MSSLCSDFIDKQGWSDQQIKEKMKRWRYYVVKPAYFFTEIAQVPKHETPSVYDMRSISIKDYYSKFLQTIDWNTPHMKEYEKYGIEGNSLNQLKNNNALWEHEHFHADDYLDNDDLDLNAHLQDWDLLMAWLGWDTGMLTSKLYFLT